MIKNFLCCIFLFQALVLFGANQTANINSVYPPVTLPFTVSIELADFTLPNGWHSGAVGTWGDRILLIAGRTNGMHGFDENPNVNNFPPSAQNTTLYVIDFKNKTVLQRDLTDPASKLKQAQIDILSVTSPQSYQRGTTLYITGGYGIDSATGEMNTKPTLTAINVPGLITWVTNPEKKGSASKYIRQTVDPLLQVTGGYMNQTDPHEPTLLIFGQNFTGLYRGGSNGIYTNQVRAFHIIDDGKKLKIVACEQTAQNPAYRRRDLNVVPVRRPGKHHSKEAYVAFSGVFTESEGVWTVPVFILPDGSSAMPNPNEVTTFKQGMNNYVCPTVGLYSRKTKDMYTVFFGGMTFGFFQNGSFQTDPEIPFTNEVTTIKLDRYNVFSQYIMADQYPTIVSTFSNPGNTLLFGAGADFIPANHLPTYPNGVVKFDKLKKPTVIGYIVGGIQSTVPNTSTNSDSAASPYIFQVVLNPK